jgi:hypothetical protein
MGNSRMPEEPVKEKRVVDLHKAISGPVHMVGVADKANIVGADGRNSTKCGVEVYDAVV